MDRVVIEDYYNMKTMNENVNWMKLRAPFYIYLVIFLNNLLDVHTRDLIPLHHIYYVH
jgi:hypothetical protein